MSEPPILRPSLAAELEARLRADLDAGRYAEGELLPPERELAARYQVARATVKQALLRLEQMGLIETRHGVGSRVRAKDQGIGADVLRWLIGLGDPKWIDDVFEARRLLGPVFAREAARRATKKDRERLEARARALRDAADADGAHAAENEVQRAIAAATGNRVFVFLVNTLIRAYAPFRQLMQSAFADPAATADALEPVVRAIGAGREEEAARAAARYFDATEAALRAGLRKGKRR